MPSISKIFRDEAVDKIVRNEILSNETRRYLLQILYSNYGWDGDLSSQLTYSWNDKFKKMMPDPEPNIIFQKIVSAGLSDEFINGVFSNIADQKYDDILYECAKDGGEYHLQDNAELLERLNSIGVHVDEVKGKMKLFACPCCGADTLAERHGWEICPVCWWEDDGTDNAEASLYYSGPNKGLQLTAARINFLTFGIYNPERHDLIEIKKPIDGYTRSRYFEINKEKSVILEQGDSWSAPLKPPHVNINARSPKVSLAGAGMRGWPPIEE